MRADVHTPRLVSFDAFKVDLHAKEVRRDGHKIRLSGQPFEVLAILLENPGEMVTREEFRKRLWPADTFVDFDHGLNTAVNRLREVLGDSTEAPRFVETLPRRGYRLIAHVAHPAAITAEPEKEPSSSRWTGGQIAVWASVAALCLAAGLFYFAKHRQRDHESKIVAPVPFTVFPGLEIAPTFSPDGSQIAFAWDGNPTGGTKGFDLFTKIVGTENLVRLTQHPSDYLSPAWSPDGTQIAFHRISGTDSGIYLVSALGGPERRLHFTHASMRAAAISWTPDGKQIAFADSPGSGGHHTLSLLSVETLETGAIRHTNDCQEEVSPVFSHDGRLAFVCYQETGGFALDLANLPGEAPRQIGRYAGWPGGITWTFEGTGIIGARHVDGIPHSELYEVSISDGALRTLSFGDNGSSPTVSPKGDKLAYEQGQVGDVDLIRRDLRHPRGEAMKLIASTRWSVVPQYSPDGKHIAFSSNRGGNYEVWMSNADGSGLVQVSNLHNPLTGSPKWSSDSTKLAFDSGSSGHAAVYVVDIAELAPRKLMTNIANASQPSWSHDGKWIYFIAGGSPGRIYRSLVEGGEATALSSATGFWPQESFDGQSVYFSANFAGNETLKVVSLKHPGVESPVDGMPGLNFVCNWVVETDGIYFLAADVPSLSYFDFSSRKVTRLIALDDGRVFGFTISPDLRWFLYSKFGHVNHDIMVVDHFR